MEGAVDVLLSSPEYFHKTLKHVWLKIADPFKLPLMDEIYVLWNSQETDFIE